MQGPDQHEHGPFETDHPHIGAIFAEWAATAQRTVTRAGLKLEETTAWLQANAIDWYRLGRYGRVA
jgi:hypothetical protein